MTATRAASLMVERCTAADVPQLAQCHQTVYANPPLYRAIFPFTDPAILRARYMAMFAAGLAEQYAPRPSRRLHYVKVIDLESKDHDIAAYILWIELPFGYRMEDDSFVQEDAHFPKDGRADISRQFKEKLSIMRGNHIGRKGPHLQLGLLGTNPSHERRGAAGLLIRWGLDLADQLAWPAYVDASMQAHILYQRYAFYDTDSIQVDLSEFQNRYSDLKGQGILTWYGMRRDPAPMINAG